MSVTRRFVNRFTRGKQLLLTAAAAALAAAAICMSIMLYIQANTGVYYEVIRNGKVAGKVSEPAVVEGLVRQRTEELAQANPDVVTYVDQGELSFRRVSAYKAKPGGEAEAAAMIESWGIYSTGTVVRVAGKPVAIAKDEASAKQALARVKARYASAAGSAGVTVDVEAPAAPAASAAKGGVRTLSFTPVSAASKAPAVEQVFIVEEIDTASMRVDPDRVASADALYERLAAALTVKTVEQSTETEAIEPEKVVRESPNMRAGKTMVVSQGARGEKRLTYRLVKSNGKLVAKEMIGEEIVKKASPVIVVKGTKIMKGVADGNFAWPVAGARMTSPYGKRWGRLHKGIDLVGSSGILAADGGVVEFAGTKNGLGKAVIIDHRNGFKTVYGHMSKLSVKKGELLEKGQKIGVMGNTGHSFGVHLHFEIYKNGKVVNPSKYL